MTYSGWTLRKVLIAGGVVIVIAIIFGGLTMVLWNWLCPDLFGLKTISFSEALGLLILFRLLFGWQRTYKHPSHSHLKRRWESMSPEERRNFAHRMHRHSSRMENAFFEEKKVYDE